MLGQQTVEPAVAEQPITFEAFRELMLKWVNRVAPRFTRRGGVFMNRQDLLAEADFALLCVYRRHSRTKPVLDLCKIATTAVTGMMLTVQRRSMNGRRAGWEIPYAASPYGEPTVSGGPGRRRVVRVVKPRVVSSDALLAVGVEPRTDHPGERLEVRLAAESYLESGDDASVVAVSEALGMSHSEASRALRRLRTLIRRELAVTKKSKGETCHAEVT